MTAKEAYDKARQLAQSGDYEQALQVLIGYDHPKIEALRTQIRDAAAARKSKNATVAQPQVTSKVIAKGIKQAETEKARRGCLVAIVLFICIFACVMYGAANGAPSLEKSIAGVCEDALKGMPQGTRCVLDQFRNEVQVCQNRYQYVLISNINDWYDCLLEQGVGSNMLDFEN